LFFAVINVVILMLFTVAMTVLSVYCPASLAGPPSLQGEGAVEVVTIDLESGPRNQVAEIAAHIAPTTTNSWTPPSNKKRG
jgi:hypothetical protein